jgi:hypothetical protein
MGGDLTSAEVLPAGSSRRGTDTQRVHGGTHHHAAESEEARADNRM